MFSSLLRILGSKEQSEEPKTVAKQRLQFLLVHDRVHLSPGQMLELRRDLIEVLSRYVEVDDSSLDVELKQLPDSRKMALVSNIPVRRVKGDSFSDCEIDSPTPLRS
jgi:cell division topological specificity factor